MENIIDPALDVPWSVYAAAESYNCLANASCSFQTTVTDFQKTGLPGQTGGQAHTTGTLAGQLTQTTTFNSPCVDYKSVFSPLFHHADPKPAHYPSTLNVSHHRQALTNAVTTTPSTVETEIISKDYSQAHHQTLVVSTNTSTCFDHQSTNSTGTWSHQGNSQLPRPFGILPHESVVVSSPNSSKPTSTYENATHFAMQTLNPLNSQLTNNSIDHSKTASCKDKKNANTGSSNNNMTLFDFLTADIAEYLTNRVPSLPHYSTQTQQQQENDRYFDFECWDIHPSPPEMFNGAAEAFASHDINFVGNPAHQHQNLMVSHPHHPPPPIPYFTPFHLSPGHAHHPQEFHTSVELTTIHFSENTQPETTNLQQQEVKYDNPKVILPDIEEEFEYLSQTGHAQAVLASQQNPNCFQQLPPPIKMPEKKQSDPNSGFVASYLKFLQGEKDTSPSPAKEDGRKTTWIRTKVYAPELKSTSVMGSKATTSGVPSAGRIKISAFPDCIKKGNKEPYNSDDDPRFYPLPKSTAIKKFDNSTAKKNDYDSSEVKRKPSKSFVKVSSSGTITSESIKGTTGKKTSGSSNKTSVSSSAREKVDSGSVPVSDPLFLSPRRKNFKRRAKRESKIKNFWNSDRAWAHGAKTGEFVVMKSHLHEEYPPVYRVHANSLLQKYEQFDENGKTLYRDTKTYCVWAARHRPIFVTVPVLFVNEFQGRAIIELFRNEPEKEDPELMKRVMKDLEKYHDSFQVYILTLISRALDPNFLTKVLEKQDGYYLNSVRAVDEVTEDHCRRLLNVTKWEPNLVVSVRTWPCIKVFQNLPKEQNSNTICSACGKLKVSVRIQMCGQPYNSTTLERCQPDPKALREKDFLLCNSCGLQVSLCSKVAHQKYLMYVECVKRVTEERSSNPNKSPACVLIKLLADETWLNELFLEVRTSWAEIEKIEHFSRESNKHLLQNAVASAGIS